MSQSYDGKAIMAERSREFELVMPAGQGEDLKTENITVSEHPEESLRSLIGSFAAANIECRSDSDAVCQSASVKQLVPQGAAEYSLAERENYSSVQANQSEAAVSLSQPPEVNNYESITSVTAGKSVAPEGLRERSTNSSESEAELNTSTSQTSARPHFRPAACIFVAGLPSHASDTHLGNELQTLFGLVGDIQSIKLLRDVKMEPYAFVQYHTVSDATRALMMSGEATIDGVHIRLEPARVNRTIFLQPATITLPTIQTADVAKLCEPFGEIEKLVEYTLPTRCWFVQYAFREDAVQAYAALRRNIGLNSQWVQNLRTEQQTRQNAEFIYVGNLSSTTTEESLLDRFSKYGVIVSAQLSVRKRRSSDKEDYHYALIQYTSPETAAAAINGANHSMFGEKKIYVTRRAHTDERFSHPIPAPPPFMSHSISANHGAGSIPVAFDPKYSRSFRQGHHTRTAPLSRSQSHERQLDTAMSDPSDTTEHHLFTPKDGDLPWETRANWRSRRQPRYTRSVKSRASIKRSVTGGSGPTLDDLESSSAWQQQLYSNEHNSGVQQSRQGVPVLYYQTPYGMVPLRGFF